MSQTLNILGIVGSLRQQSFNLGLLQAAQELAPSGVRIEIARLHELPLYNADDDGNPHAAVVAFKQKIVAADALLFATPEYNYSIPGVLKNAIDQASRPPGQGVWGGKPAAIMGASPGPFGTARSQYELRKVLGAVDMLLMNSPEVLVTLAQDKFDAQGRLTDERTRAHVAKTVQALADWTLRLRGPAKS